MFTIGQTTKPPSNCSTELCNSSLSSNASCSSPITCYSFRTSINTNLCAPKDDCSLFDKCINGTKCATNTSVCVVNSCCAVPICIPVVFSRICTQQNNTNSCKLSSKIQMEILCNYQIWRKLPINQKFMLLSGPHTFSLNFALEGGGHGQLSHFILGDSHLHPPKTLDKSLTAVCLVSSGRRILITCDIHRSLWLVCDQQSPSGRRFFGSGSTQWAQCVRGARVIERKSSASGRPSVQSSNQ